MLMTQKLLRLLGVGIFALAFFLPAVRESRGIVHGGWECAEVTLAMTPEMVMGIGEALKNQAFGSILMTLSGWVNPLVVIYLVVCILNRWVRVRRLIAGAIVVCVVTSWATLAMCELTPLIGHFLWIGGIALILAPEIVKRKAEKASEASPSLKP